MNSIIQDIKLKFKYGSPTVKLIIVNVSVFIVLVLLKLIVNFSTQQKIFSTLTYDWLGFNLSGIQWIYKPWTIITYMFMHDLSGIFHLLWNVLFLYWFGKIVEDFIGQSKIIPLYILGGITGALLSWLIEFLFISSSSGLFMPLIGASGAVYAVMIGAVVIVPDYKFNLLFIGPVSIKYIALFKLILDLLNISEFENVGGHICHLGGAIFGFVYIKSMRNGLDLAKYFNSFTNAIVSIFHKKKKLKVVHKTALKNDGKNTSNNQQKLDEILDKISKSGYESLSKEEKDFLFKASKD